MSTNPILCLMRMRYLRRPVVNEPSSSSSSKFLRHSTSAVFPKKLKKCHLARRRKDSHNGHARLKSKWLLPFVFHANAANDQKRNECSMYSDKKLKKISKIIMKLLFKFQLHVYFLIPVVIFKFLEATKRRPTAIIKRLKYMYSIIKKIVKGENNILIPIDCKTGSVYSFGVCFDRIKRRQTIYSYHGE